MALNSKPREAIQIVGEILDIFLSFGFTQFYLFGIKW